MLFPGDLDDCLQPFFPGDLDKQPKILNLLQKVSMTEALGSKLAKPLWLESKTNEHMSQIVHLMGDLVLPSKNEKVIGCMRVLSCKLNEAKSHPTHSFLGGLW